MTTPEQRVTMKWAISDAISASVGRLPGERVTDAANALFALLAHIEHLEARVKAAEALADQADIAGRLLRQMGARSSIDGMVEFRHRIPGGVTGATFPQNTILGVTDLLWHLGNAFRATAVRTGDHAPVQWAGPNTAKPSGDVGSVGAGC